MNYGLYLAAGGAMTSMHRLEVAANNLANANTTGFKPDMAVSQARLPARLNDAALAAPPRELLEQLGGGNWLGPSRFSMAQGALEPSDNALDVAIDGDGFFVVAGADQSGPLLTRDGRMTLNDRGELVSAATGRAVLDVNDAAIRLDPSASETSIDRNGVIRQDGRPMAQLQLASAAPGQLTKLGENLFGAANGALDTSRRATGGFVQHHLEGSAVNPITVLNHMIDASRAIENNARMMQYMDQTLEQTINTFGRVA